MQLILNNVITIEFFTHCAVIKRCQALSNVVKRYKGAKFSNLTSSLMDDMR